MPVEIKLGKTATRQLLAGLEKWIELAGNRVTDPTMIIYGGAESYRYRGILVVGWLECGKILAKHNADSQP